MRENKLGPPGARMWWSQQTDWLQICRQTSHRHGGPVLGTSRLIKMQGKKTSLGSWAEAGLVDFLVDLYASFIM